MEISALKIALLVQAQGSFAGAARVQDVDPSSISRTVAAVEAELGIRLFHRTTRRLTATEEGQIYLQRMAPLIEEMRAAEEAASGHQTRPEGVLKMTASVAFATHMLVPRLPEFQTMYPDITVDLHCSDANLDLVENGIDLAIRLAPAPKGDLISTRLVRTRYRVVASPAYLRGREIGPDPRVLSSLACLRFSLPNFDDQWQFQKGGADAFSVVVRGGLMASNALALRQAALSGMGVALLPDWLVDQDVKAGRLSQLFTDYQSTATDFETSAWGLYPSRAYLPRKVKAMLEFLRTQLRV